MTNHRLPLLNAPLEVANASFEAVDEGTLMQVGDLAREGARESITRGAA